MHCLSLLYTRFKKNLVSFFEVDKYPERKNSKNTDRHQTADKTVFCCLFLRLIAFLVKPGFLCIACGCFCLGASRRAVFPFTLFRFLTVFVCKA